MGETTKNKDLASLHGAVGEAVATWSHIEAQLRNLFSIAADLVVMQPRGRGFTSNSPVAFAVLNTLGHFNQRLQVLDAVLTSELRNLDDEASTTLNEWASLRRRLAKIHENRSMLATWFVVEVLNPDGSVKRAILSPPTFDYRKWAVETDVRRWTRAFQKARSDLHDLAARLSSHKGLQRKHLKRAFSQVEWCLPYDTDLLEQLKHFASFADKLLSGEVRGDWG